MTLHTAGEENSLMSYAGFLLRQVYIQYLYIRYPLLILARSIILVGADASTLSSFSVQNSALPGIIRSTE